MNECISCATVSGEFAPPGGIIYEDDYWIFALRAKPLLRAGSGFLILKRHCEDFNDLSIEELHTLSENMQRISKTYTQVLQAEKTHFALYGEGVKHIHMHIFPRTSDLPAGNIPLTYMNTWYSLLNRIGLKRPIPDEQVAAIADKLRSALKQA